KILQTANFVGWDNFISMFVTQVHDEMLLNHSLPLSLFHWWQRLKRRNHCFKFFSDGSEDAVFLNGAFELSLQCRIFFLQSRNSCLVIQVFRHQMSPLRASWCVSFTNVALGTSTNDPSGWTS